MSVPIKGNTANDSELKARIKKLPYEAPILVVVDVKEKTDSNSVAPAFDAFNSES